MQCSIVRSSATASCRALELDERNFHAWNYRQFIVKLMGRSLTDELQYAEDKVCTSLST